MYESQYMRNRIFGIIGILWGGAVVVSFLMREKPVADGAYGAGQSAALILGAVMLIAGVYYTFKGDK